MFGSAVTNPFTRHLTVTASGFGTLAQMHPGRIILGIGRGDSAVRPMGLPPVRTKVLGEAIPVLRELLGGRSVQMNDTDVHLAGPPRTWECRSCSRPRGRRTCARRARWPIA